MSDPATTPDPGAPARKLGHEAVLWGGFVLCLAIAVVTVVLPELSGGEAPNKKPPTPAPAR